MRTVLMFLMIIIIIVVSIDIILYFVKSMSPKEKPFRPKTGKPSFQESLTPEAEDEKVIIIEVEFKGYKGTYTYGVVEPTVYKGQYVLVLTRDGIRCAKVVADSKTIKQSQLNLPPFLLENIICIADEEDLEYYS